MSGSDVQNGEGEKQNADTGVKLQGGGKRPQLLNQPDKLLPNGKVCPFCLVIVEDE